MTNYTNYPKYRLVKNSCIISFDDGTYSWTMLDDKQKKYLVESKYLDHAVCVDVMSSMGSKKTYTVEEFKEWAKRS